MTHEMHETLVWDPRSKINSQLEYFTDIALKESRNWIEAVTCKVFNNPDDARSSLRNGILLCELLNAIHPGCVKRINRLPTPLAGVDNLNIFLEACERSFNLKGSQLFDPGDLLDLSHRADCVEESQLKSLHNRRLRNVIVTIYWLGKNVSGRYDGPQLDLKAFSGLVKNYTAGEDKSASSEHRKQESFDSWDSPPSTYSSYRSDDTVKPESTDYLHCEKLAASSHHHRDSSYESFGSYDRHNSDDGTDTMPVGYESVNMRRHGHGTHNNNNNSKLAYSATLDDYYDPDEKLGSGMYKSNPDLSKTYTFGVDPTDNYNRARHDAVHTRFSSCDGLDDHHSRQSSDSDGKGSLRRTSTAQPAHNPLQFIKLSTPSLAHTAEEQIKQARESKKQSEKAISVQHDQEDWKLNFSSWKDRRRKSSHHDRVKDMFPESTMDNNGNNGNGRRQKTFRDMMKSRGQRDGGRSKSFSSFTYDAENEQEEDAFESSEEAPVQPTSVKQEESSPRDRNANKLSSLKSNFESREVKASPKVTPKPMPRGVKTKPPEVRETENPFRQFSETSAGAVQRLNGGEDRDRKPEAESDSSSEDDEDIKRLNSLNSSLNNAGRDNKDYVDMVVELCQPEKEKGFGFTIKGGRDVSQAVTVEHVKIGSVAYDSDLLEGDEIVLINNEPVSGLFLGSVKLMINTSSTKKGEMTLKIRRFHETSKIAIRSRPDTVPKVTSRLDTAPKVTTRFVAPARKPAKASPTKDTVSRASEEIVKEAIVPTDKQNVQSSNSSWLMRDKPQLKEDFNGRDSPLSVDTVDSEEERRIMADIDREVDQEEKEEELHSRILEDEAHDKDESSAESQDTVVRRIKIGRNSKIDNLKRRSDFFGFEDDGSQFDTPGKGSSSAREESVWQQKVEKTPTKCLAHQSEPDQQAMWQRVEGGTKMTTQPGNPIHLTFQARSPPADEDEIEKQEREIIENLEREEKARKAETLPAKMSSTTAFEQFNNERNTSMNTVQGRSRDLESAFPLRRVANKARNVSNRRSLFDPDDEKRRMGEWQREQDRIRQNYEKVMHQPESVRKLKEQYEKEQHEMKHQYELDQQRIQAQKQLMEELEVKLTTKRSRSNETKSAKYTGKSVVRRSKSNDVIRNSENILSRTIHLREMQPHTQATNENKERSGNRSLYAKKEPRWAASTNVGPSRIGLASISDVAAIEANGCVRQRAVGQTTSALRCKNASLPKTRSNSVGNLIRAFEVSKESAQETRMPRVSTLPRRKPSTAITTCHANSPHGTSGTFSIDFKEKMKDRNQYPTVSSPARTRAQDKRANMSNDHTGVASTTMKSNDSTLTVCPTQKARAISELNKMLSKNTSGVNNIFKKYENASSCRDASEGMSAVNKRAIPRITVEDSPVLQVVETSQNSFIENPNTDGHDICGLKSPIERNINNRTPDRTVSVSNTGHPISEIVADTTTFTESGRNTATDVEHCAVALSRRAYTPTGKENVTMDREKLQCYRKRCDSVSSECNIGCDQQSTSCTSTDLSATSGFTSIESICSAPCVTGLDSDRTPSEASNHTFPRIVKPKVTKKTTLVPRVTPPSFRSKADLYKSVSDLTVVGTARRIEQSPGRIGVCSVEANPQAPCGQTRHLYRYSSTKELQNYSDSSSSSDEDSCGRPTEPFDQSIGQRRDFRSPTEPNATTKPNLSPEPAPTSFDETVRVKYRSKENGGRTGIEKSRSMDNLCVLGERTLSSRGLSSSQSRRSVDLAAGSQDSGYFSVIYNCSYKPTSQQDLLSHRSSLSDIADKEIQRILGGDFQQEKSPASTASTSQESEQNEFSPQPTKLQPRLSSVWRPTTTFLAQTATKPKETPAEQHRTDRAKLRQREAEQLRQSEEEERLRLLEEKENQLRKEEERLKLEQERLRAETEKIQQERFQAQRKAPQPPTQTFYQPQQFVQANVNEEPKGSNGGYSRSVHLIAAPKVIQDSVDVPAVKHAEKPLQSQTAVKTFTEHAKPNRLSTQQAAPVMDREEVLKINRKPSAFGKQTDQNEPNRSFVSSGRKDNPIQQQPLNRQALLHINAVPKTRKLDTWIIPETERDKRPSKRRSVEIGKPTGPSLQEHWAMEGKPTGPSLQEHWVVEGKPTGPSLQEHWVVEEAERRRIAEQNDKDRIQKQQSTRPVDYNKQSQETYRKNLWNNDSERSSKGNSAGVNNQSQPVRYSRPTVDIQKESNVPLRSSPQKSPPSPTVQYQSAVQQLSRPGHVSTTKQHPGRTVQNGSSEVIQHSIPPQYNSSRFVSQQPQPGHRQLTPPKGGFQPVASSKPEERGQLSPPSKPPRASSTGSSNESGDNSMMSVSGKQKCSHCNQELGRGAAMIIESLNLYYHVQCFRCCVCHAPLGNGQRGADVRVRVNKLHCRNCYSNDEGTVFNLVGTF